MRTRTGIILAAAAVVAAGAAVEARIRLGDARQRAAAAEAELAQRPQPERVLVPQTQVVTLPADATNSALRGAFERLQQQVASLASERDRLESDLAAAQRNLSDATNGGFRFRGPRDGGGSNESRRASFEARMAQMQRDDPAGYAEMQKRREEFRQRMEKEARDRADFLEQVDTAGMTEAQIANHQQLVQLADQTRALLQQLQQGGLTPEQTAPIREQLAANYPTLRDLYAKERVNLYQQIGVQLGYTHDQAVQFADTIQYINEQTSPQMQGFGRGPGGRRGPDGRGGNGGGTTTTAAPTAPAQTP
jgi:hypothetical protein